ncbi:MAG: multidrug ABC transporter ATP-binding protein, partial [Patescibacteria group bacterium]|nr:multidrug ABC transporter ATP-binding protein [Patescibacteria group bacterium]
CNKVGIIERGELLVCAEVSEVMRKVRNRMLLNIRVAEKTEAAAKLLEANPLVELVDVREETINVTLAEHVTDYSELATLLVQAGHRLLLFREDEINLETAFMTLTKGITA